MSNVHSSLQIVLGPQLTHQLQQQLQRQEPDNLGNAQVFEALLPQLYGQSGPVKKSLQKVDYYMLEETHELYTRLARFCDALQLDPDCEFKVARQYERLVVIGDIPGREQMCALINGDPWFVDSFSWLQPNYALLAHSFEMLEYSECYEKSPLAAAQKYAHFNRPDKGLLFALQYQGGRVNAQVETPVNLYCV